MVESLVPYFTAGTLLSFFWAYGIVSFVLDLKNKVIPGIIQYRRGRRQQKREREREREAERAEREQELY